MFSANYQQPTFLQQIESFCKNDYLELEADEVFKGPQDPCFGIET